MKIGDKLLTNEGSIFLGQRKVGAVENCDDDNQSDCIGKDKVRVDSSKSMGSHNCDCCSDSLAGIKFELDFHCHER
jgi:hypothetical protein